MTIQIPDAEITLSYARSGGKGGQNVNKVSSKVVLHWNPDYSRVLTTDQLYRLKASALFKNRANLKGEIVLSCDTERSQELNRNLVLEKLNQLVTQALHVQRKRVATKPSRASKERRLKAKRVRSDRMRGRKISYE